MDNKINQIIEELISLDPSFAARRSELEKILRSVVSVKPDPVLDPEFVRNLRVQLLEKAEGNQNVSTIWSNFKNNFMKKILISASAVVVVLLAVVVGLEKSNLKNTNNSLLSLGSDVRINHTNSGAFGNLATLSLATGMGGGGGGGSAPMAATDSSRASLGMGGGGTADAKIAVPPYQPVNYKYVYKGEDIALDSDKLDVLKKETPDTGALLSSLGSFDLGLVNLNSFSGSKLQSLSLNQDGGYNIYVDLVGGNISLSGYFDVMPLSVDSRLCAADGCPQPEQIKESDIPDDSTLIGIANQFLSEHGISTAAYAQPEVQNSYRIQNEAMLKQNPKALVYWPEYINVVYPLKIQDGEVYDESGQKMGLMVGVNIRNNKVTSVSNLSTQVYQASSYDAITDSATVLKIAQQGGLYGNYTDDSPNTKTVEVELGTPTIQYVSMWDYQNNVSQQVLVPSLVFPVTNQPDGGYFYRTAVVVPLIKDILNRYGSNGGDVQIFKEIAPAVAPKAAQ